MQGALSKLRQAPCCPVEPVLTDPANQHPKPRRGRKPQDTATIAKPSWADDLRKLYDDVVAEPLPDSFEELLRKLDQDGNG